VSNINKIEHRKEKFYLQETHSFNVKSQLK